MKRVLTILAIVLLSLYSEAQTQHMKFLNIDLNCTLSTFASKLKGKGFVQDMTKSHDNVVVAKGMFAGEKVVVEVKCATKTHLVYCANVCFPRSTGYNYEELKQHLIDKYGTTYTEKRNIKDGKGFVKYTTDYAVWEVGKDETTGEYNRIILSKCDYSAPAPYVISYIDNINSKIDIQEIISDF